MKDTLTAGLVLIGDELLSGSIQDLNLAHIAKTIETRGIRVRETRIIPDIENEIVDSVNALRHKFDYVFTTGGIGPTHDDITSISIAKAFDVENVIQPLIYDRIESHLRDKGIEFTAAAQRMAYAPEGSEVIEADHSIVPGYRKDNVYVMAGVPRIMQIMLDAILDKLEKGEAIISKEVHANVGEGEIAASLESIQLSHPDISIGSYPQDIGSTRSNYRVVFVVRGTDVKELSIVSNEILEACLKNGFEAVKI